MTRLSFRTLKPRGLFINEVNAEAGQLLALAYSAAPCARCAIARRSTFMADSNASCSTFPRLTKM